jgi:tripartite-type tricarboxylate transporter receptor subunit TctC
MNKKLALLGLCLGLVFPAGTVTAEDLEKFYSGKTMTMIVGTDAGGGYDVYARLLTRHIKDFIPGKPTITVQNMPGAGGLLAVNHVFNNAKRDGTVFAMVPASNLLDGALGNPNAKFDLASFTAIGNMNAENDNCIVWRGRGTESTDDLFKKDVITGATGQASNSYIYPALMNSVLNTRFKLVSGYPGTDRMRLMEKGEMDAACGIFTSTLQTQMGQLLDGGKIFVAIQMGLSRHPSFAGVPNAVELAKNEADRELLALAFSPLEMGRPIIAPPLIPGERVDALQAAFVSAMKDDGLSAEAAQLKLELRWFDAKRLRQILADMSSAPEPVKKRARTLLTPAQ